MDKFILDNPVYFDCPIPELSGNPLIEALQTPPASNEEAIRRLSKKPEFNVKEREIPNAYRVLLPNRLTHFMFPTKQHVQILNRIYPNIINGYRSRNPTTVNGQKFLYNTDNFDTPINPVIDTPSHRPSTVSVLTGLSGLGKSTLIRAIMHSISMPVIKHSAYKDQPFTETQLLYLMRNVPDQCTVKAFCKSFGDCADSLLGMRFYSKAFADKSSTRTHYISELKRIVVNNHVGAIIIDEFQNLSLAGTKGKSELIALILNLRDEIGVPIILVGTYKAVNVLKGDASLARRLAEGGFHELKRPLQPSDEDWQALCKITWKYQWVREPLSIHDEIIDVLYDCTQGITGIMLSLFKAAQIEAIHTGKETVDHRLIKSVYNNHFTPLHGVINALRSNDSTLLEQYDDLILNAFYELKKNPLHGCLNLLQNQINHTYNQNTLNTEVKPVDSNTKEKHDITNYSTKELYSEVCDGNPNIDDVLR